MPHAVPYLVMGLRGVLATVFGIKLNFGVSSLVPRYDPSQVLGAEPLDVPEDLLLEDKISVLHPDGSTTNYFHVVARVVDPILLDAWEYSQYLSPARYGKTAVLRAGVFGHDGSWHPAVVKRLPFIGADGQQAIATEIIMGGLVPGCVLELEVQFEQYDVGPYGPNIFAEMFMETTSPCRVRRFAVAVPRERALAVDTFTYDEEPKIFDSGAYRVWLFESNNAPGRLGAPLAPAARDEVPTVEVSTLDTWGPVAKGYLRQLKPAALPRLTAMPASTNLPDDPLEQALWAYEYVSREIRYGRPLGHDSLAARSPADTARELRGDCKDKVSLLEDLLTRFGFRCSFVLVETLRASRRPFLPAPRFDHTILLAQRDDVELWLEPTPGRVDFNYVPGHLQGNPGLVLDEDDPRQIALPLFPVERNQDKRVISGKITDDGDLLLTLDAQLTGDFAQELRDISFGLDHDLRLENVTTQLASRFPGVHVERMELENLDALGKPLRELIDVRVPRWCRDAGAFQLFRLPWRYVLSSAPVGLPKRDCGLRMGNRRREHDTIELQVPSGWKIAGGTVSIERRVDEALYSLEVSVEGRTLKARRVYEVLEREAPKESYSEVKEFFEESARDDQRDLVFELEASSN